MSQETKKAKTKDGRIVEVYKLKPGYSTPDHKWCNFNGCTETFTDDELTFIS